MFQSPLEILTSYGNACCSGAITVCLVAAYGHWIRSGGIAAMDPRVSLGH